MKKTYIYPILLILAAIMLLPSCVVDNEEVTPDEYCYISSFRIGTLKRTIYTVNEEGEDSAYTVTFSGDLYPMSIDQRTLTIENRDSLPYGTRVKAALATIDYNGVLVYKEAEDEEWRSYSASDSIDFSAPVEFAVYSSSGNSKRTYKVKLNVHKQDGKRFVWNSLAESNEIEALTERKLIANNDNLIMMGKTAMGAVVCATRPTDMTSNWTVSATTGAGMADVSSLQTDLNGLMMMSTTTGAILQSENGIDWLPITDVKDGRKLVGYGYGYLFAITNGKLESSYNQGADWADENLDDEETRLPDSNCTLIQCLQSNGYQRLVLAGNNASATDKNVEVWSKAWIEPISYEPDVKWMYYPHTADNKFLCPQMDPLFILPYNNGIIAFGGASRDGKSKAFESMLYSPDYGLTWKEDSELMLPSQLKGCTDLAAATVDHDNFIWIVAGKTTWRGRLNRLGYGK